MLTLRLALQWLWRSDQPGRPACWALIGAIFAAPDIDPVVANVALRTAVESVEAAADVGGLVGRIAASSTASGLATMLARLSRFVRIEIDAIGSMGPDHALAWATLAAAPIAQPTGR